MFGKSKAFYGALLTAALFAVGVMFAGSPAAADEAAWHVSKSSGEVWLATPGVQPAALATDAILKPGDMIRTGANGRVLLERGAETILISPNSVVGVPVRKTSDATPTMPTTIIQRAGTILLDVERQNVQHFEVATPYLAAVVKGTQFRVSVEGKTSKVEVLRGQVQVTDYKTGQRALVNKDQMASVAVQGKSGLSLSGSGAFNPIELTAPGASPVMPVEIDVPAAAQARTAEATPMQAAPMAANPVHRVEWKQQDQDSGWASGAMAWGRGLLGLGPRKNGDDDMTIIAIPVLIGLSATVGALAMRRKRKSSPDQKRR